MLRAMKGFNGKIWQPEEETEEKPPQPGEEETAGRQRPSESDMPGVSLRRKEEEASDSGEGRVPPEPAGPEENGLPDRGRNEAEGAGEETAELPEEPGAPDGEPEEPEINA